MKQDLEDLLKYRKTYFSQNGEDGFLEHLLSRLPNTNKWCVEFGAWDGKHLSNTFHFISKMKYNAVLIEGDFEKCKLLSKNMKEYGAICINKFVDFKGGNSLDNILSETQIPKDFDLLSIDIDGNDYQVWQSLEKYFPKIVIIEINIRDKPTVERINKPGSDYVWGVSGSSIKSMTELAKTKGYSLVANISCNAIYVRNEYLRLFHTTPVTNEDVYLFEMHNLNELSTQEKQNLGSKRVFMKLLKQWYHKIIGS